MGFLVSNMMQTTVVRIPLRPLEKGFGVEHSLHLRLPILYPVPLKSHLISHALWTSKGLGDREEAEKGGDRTFPFQGKKVNTVPLSIKRPPPPPFPPLIILHK